MAPTNHAVLAHHFDNIEQQREAETLGMWVFLCTEILIFGVLFTGYTAYHYKYGPDFEATSAELNVLIGAINTFVLLSSSLTMALSVYATRAGYRKMQLTCLALTAALGSLFMVFKAIEYYGDYRDGLVPGLAFPPPKLEGTEVNLDHVKLMLMFYYVMTGLHAVHLMVGIGLIVWLMVRAARASLTPAHYSPVEVCGLYWHFVDVIWIFLLPLLYLTGTHHWNELHF